MKKLLYLLLISLPTFGFGQEINLPIDSTTNKISYSEVIDIKGPKSDLYKKGLDWMVGVFKSSNDVIQVKDESEGKIIAKYIIKTSGSASIINVKLSVFFKDDRYKYVFSDIFFDGVNAQWDLHSDISQWKMAKSSQRYVKQLVNKDITNLIFDLKKHMESKIENNF